MYFAIFFQRLLLKMFHGFLGKSSANFCSWRNTRKTFKDSSKWILLLILLRYFQTFVQIIFWEIYQTFFKTSILYRDFLLGFFRLYDMSSNSIILIAITPNSISSKDPFSQIPLPRIPSPRKPHQPEWATTLNNLLETHNLNLSLHEWKKNTHTKREGRITY